MRNLILSGGVAHDYARTSPMLVATLSEVGIDSHIHESFAVVEDERLDTERLEEGWTARIVAVRA